LFNNPDFGCRNCIHELYWESVHSLTEFTSIEIAIRVKIYYHEENDRFDAFIYAMRRIGDNTPAYPEEEAQIVLQKFRSEGIVENYHCVSNAGKISASDFRQQSRLGVEIFFKHRINEQITMKIPRFQSTIPMI
jgi:hypothetical protein